MLLASIHTPKTQDFIAHLAHREQWAITAFLDSLEITYFFVGADSEQHTLLQRCGPNQKSVLDLLRTRPHSTRRRATTQGEDKVKLDRIWQAVKILADELKSIDRISFSLLWDGHGAATPELDFSFDRTRQNAWDYLWKSLPIKARHGVPLEPPQHPVEPEERWIEPTPPTVEEPDSPGIRWHEFQQCNFDREPAWRWSRAWSLVRHGRYISLKRDDVETASAVRFLRQLVKCPQDAAQLAHDFPNLLAAHDLRTEDRDRSLELECRLLARQSSVEIAERLSISPGTIDAYCKLFYDIKERLDSRTYIVKKLLGVRGGVDDQHAFEHVFGQQGFERGGVLVTAENQNACLLRKQRPHGIDAP